MLWTAAFVFAALSAVNFLIEGVVAKDNYNWWRPIRGGLYQLVALVVFLLANALLFPGGSGG